MNKNVGLRNMDKKEIINFFSGVIVGGVFGGYMGSYDLGLTMGFFFAIAAFIAGWSMFGDNK